MNRTVLSVLAACGLLAGLVSVVAAGPFQPAPGTAVVDGDPGEWDLVRDFFSGMYRAGDPAKPLESRVYLRYDCLSSTLYMLVIAEPELAGLREWEEAWVAIDALSRKLVVGSGRDSGAAAEFAWVGEGFDGDPTHVRGYEASFTLYEGRYEFLAHLNVLDEGRTETSGTPGFPWDGPEIEIECGTTPVAPVTWSRLKQRYR